MIRDRNNLTDYTYYLKRTINKSVKIGEHIFSFATMYLFKEEVSFDFYEIFDDKYVDKLYESEKFIENNYSNDAEKFFKLVYPDDRLKIINAYIDYNSIKDIYSSSGFYLPNYNIGTNNKIAHKFICNSNVLKNKKRSFWYKTIHFKLKENYNYIFKRFDFVYNGVNNFFELNLKEYFNLFNNHTSEFNFLHPILKKKYKLILKTNIIENKNEINFRFNCMPNLSSNEFILVKIKKEVNNEYIFKVITYLEDEFLIRLNGDNKMITFNLYGIVIKNKVDFFSINI